MDFVSTAPAMRNVAVTTFAGKLPLFTRLPVSIRAARRAAIVGKKITRRHRGSAARLT